MKHKRLDRASPQGWRFEGNPYAAELPLDGLVENKGFSMFRLIEEIDYQAGLMELKKDYENKTIIHSNHGESLLWLRKAENI